MHFGKVLQRLREREECSVEDLARRLGIASITIWERERKESVTTRTVDLHLKALGLGFQAVADVITEMAEVAECEEPDGLRNRALHHLRLAEALLVQAQKRAG